MSLTAFQRYRRMQQVEEMKPENIIKAQEAKEEVVTSTGEVKVEEPKVEAPVEEKPKTTTSTARRRNTTRK